VTQQARVLITAAGLDGQMVEREVGKYKLAPGATSDVTLPISSLPVQSELAMSFAALQVETVRGSQVIRASQTRPAYYIFSGGYAQAELYSSDEVADLPNGGLLATDFMDVRGRVLDATGVAQEVTASALSVSTGSRQGLSRMRRVAWNAGSSTTGPLATAPSTVASTTAVSNAMAGIATPAAPAGPAAISQTHYVRPYWRVRYSDVGGGEDVWQYQGYQWVPASYAWISIDSGPGGVNYYYAPIAGQSHLPCELTA
jgi:hypothetical protein